MQHKDVNVEEANIHRDLKFIRTYRLSPTATQIHTHTQSEVLENICTLNGCVQVYAVTCTNMFMEQYHKGIVFREKRKKKK